MQPFAVWKKVIVLAVLAVGLAPGQFRQQAEAQLRLPQARVHPRGRAVQQAVMRLAGVGAPQAPVFALRQDGTLRYAAGFAEATGAATPESAAQAFVRGHAGLFGSEPSPWLEVRKVQRIGDYSVVRLEQVVDGVPVHGHEAVLVLDQSNSIRIVSAHYAVVPARRAGWQIDREQATFKAMARSSGKSPQARLAERVWVADGEDLVPAWRVVTEEADRNSLPVHWCYLISADTGEVLEARDLRPGQSRTAKAAAFPINPLMGDPVAVTLEDLTSNSAYLFGSYAKVYSNLKALLGQSPAGRVEALAAADAAGNYPYVPMDPRHAEVQLYYSVDRAARNFKSIGFPDVGRPLEAVALWADCDANGCTTQNNAYFDPYGFSGRGGLFFYFNRNGEPSYDTSLVYHEFTHSIVNNIVGPYYGATFNSLNEGTADYFSSSFLADPVQMPYAALLWGMRLPYVRMVDNKNSYPRNLIGEPHMDGNIWSAALWDLRKLLGAAREDTGALLTIASLPPTAEFYDAAVAARNVTALLYGHSDARAAGELLAARGLLSETAALGASPRLLRSGALPVVDSIAPAGDGGGLLADRQFRFSVPPAATSVTLRIAGNGKLVALLKHRGPVVVYNDGSTNADYITDIASQVTLRIDSNSDPEIQFGDYYLWVGHFNAQDTTEYGVVLDLQTPSYSLRDLRLSEVPVNGAPASGSMPAGPILNSREFLIRVPESATELGIKLEGETDVDLYLRAGQPVIYNNQGFPEAEVVRTTEESTEVAVLTRNTVPSLVPGDYVAAVYNYDATNPTHFRVTAVTTTNPAPRTDLVALPARTPGSLDFPRAYGAAVLADKQFILDVPAGTASMRLTLVTDLDARVYIRPDDPIVMSTGWPVASYSFKSMEGKSFEITTSSTAPLKPGRYYVWVANASDRPGLVSLSYTLY